MIRLFDADMDECSVDGLVVLQVLGIFPYSLPRPAPAKAAPAPGSIPWTHGSPHAPKQVPVFNIKLFLWSILAQMASFFFVHIMISRFVTEVWVNDVGEVSFQYAVTAELMIASSIPAQLMLRSCKLAAVWTALRGGLKMKHHHGMQESAIPSQMNATKKKSLLHILCLPVLCTGLTVMCCLVVLSNPSLSVTEIIILCISSAYVTNANIITLALFRMAFSALAQQLVEAVEMSVMASTPSWTYTRSRTSNPTSTSNSTSTHNTSQLASMTGQALGDAQTPSPLHHLESFVLQVSHWKSYTQRYQFICKI